MPKLDHPIVVIGAGICGVSTALWLRRFGHDVVLIDRDTPGMGASYGNAGLLAQWAVVPVTTPDLWQQIPKYLLSPNSPLFLQWSYLPKMLPWLARYMSHATDAKTHKIVEALTPLLGDAVEQHKSLVHGTPLENWIVNSKLSYAYRSRDEFERDAYGWSLKQTAGFTPTLLTGHDVQEAEPILGHAIQCLAVLEGQGHILNPAQYIQEMVQYFQAEGGKFVQADFLDFRKVGVLVSEVLTSQGTFPCSKAVITAGIWSKDVMRKLGLSVPLETERGYHVIFENPSIMPNNPMMMTTGKFGVTPMDMGLRCAGTVELGSTKKAASKAPVQLIYKYSKEAFPDLAYSGTQEWMGFRPSTPDSLPLIGELGQSGIYTGFGHQHIGLTAGPKTGRLIAQMISDQPSNQNLTPFDPNRYAV